MSVRKGSVGGSSLGARGEAISKRSSPVSDYSAAVAVLNEDNMTQACALLLSEKDYESNQMEEESDYQKLLKLFEQCQEASKIIEKRAPTSLPTLAQKQQQHQRGPPIAARAQAVPLKPKVKAMVPPRRTSMPSRATAKKAGPPAHSFAPPPSRKLKRDTSNSSSASTSSVGSGRSAKKSRLSPPTINNQDADGGAVAPPPEAMSFLAALNSQGGKPRKPQRLEEKETPTKPKELPTSVSGSRRQPSRSSRKG